MIALWLLPAFALGLLVARYWYRDSIRLTRKDADLWHREHGYRVREKERLRDELYDAEKSLSLANRDLAALKNRKLVVLPESEAVADLEAQVAFRDAEIRALTQAQAARELDFAAHATRADETIVMYEKNVRRLEDELIAARQELASWVTSAGYTEARAAEVIAMLPRKPPTTDDGPEAA